MNTQRAILEPVEGLKTQTRTLMKIEFDYSEVCGVKRFYPRNRYGTHICTLAGRKCLRSQDVQTLQLLGIAFDVFKQDRKLEYGEIQALIQSPYRDPAQE